MRVIVNLASDRAAHIAGWRARAVQIDGTSEAAAAEVLKAVTFTDGSSLFDLVTDGTKLKAGWKVYINGIPQKGNDLAVSRITDNMQIHVMNTK